MSPRVSWWSHPMKVLIIDDEADIRKIARLSLGRIGKMDVVDAESGAEGIEKALAEKPDAILLDVVMPELDGPGTLAALLGDPRTASIPVLFLTGKNDPSEIEHLKSLGARGVLTKPFDPMTLPRDVEARLADR